MAQLTVNPLKIHELIAEKNSIEALNAFFESQKKDNIHVWQANQSYCSVFNNVPYEFTFTDPLLRRKKDNNKPDTFHIYQRSLLGKGGYGRVYPIKGRIKFENSLPVLKPIINKIVKIQTHDSIHKPSKAIDEHNALVHAGHIKVGGLLFSQDNSTSYLIMEKVEGISLEDLLHPKKRARFSPPLPVLTTLQRVELSITILKAIKEQVMDRSLIHRDIKPANIIIDFNQSPPKVTIIDYGLAIKSGTQDYARVGTRAYRSPESFKVKPVYTPKSDVYSAGRMLSYLWGDSYANYYIKQDQSYAHIRSKSTNSALFSNRDIKLFKKDQLKIRSFLFEMMKESPMDRADFNQAITWFSHLDTENYKNPKISCLSKNELSWYEQHLINQFKSLQDQLKLLEMKAFNLRARHFVTAAEEVQKLYDILSMHTMLYVTKPDPSQIDNFRHHCLEKIADAKMNPLIQQHRDVWWLVAEISSMIGLLGIGYLVAVGVNYYRTGRIGLFAQTKTEQFMDEVQEGILRVGV